MSDMNTTRHDGRECEGCGEAATAAPMVQGRMFPVPLCGNCRHDLLTECPGCGHTIWQARGERIYTSSNLYCSLCAVNINTAAAVTAARQDEDRDDFNEVRR